jgi:transcriptional regulator with PAS, ATPase and Fis domain
LTQDKIDPIVATNKEMSGQLARAKKAAASTATVLLLGETGTGKEVLAHAIHRWSPRCNKPFVALNCSAFPESLLEAELFGCEKGAHSTAYKRMPGKIDSAERGTLFLDEIGDMPLAMQSKLLRLLNDGTFFGLAGTQTIQADVRFIAATNKDLHQAMDEGTFREDLYFCLAVITVTPTPLRARMDDLLALAQHFVNSRPRKLGLHKRYRLSDLAVEALQGYSWPGNIREWTT